MGKSNTQQEGEILEHLTTFRNKTGICERW
jgi:hypothetical protein